MSTTIPLSINDMLADPDLALSRAREAGPVVTTELGTLIVRYEAVRNVLQDPRLRPSFSKFLERMGITSGPFYEWMSISPLDMEGETHRAWRQLVLRTFTPRSVERLRPFLRAEADRLIDDFPAEGRLEFIDAFARKLPSLGLCELIGVPAEDRSRFGVWADTIGLGFNLVMAPARIGEIDDALVQLLDYSKALVNQRRSAPLDDLVSRLARSAEEDGIQVDKIHATVAGLVFAGHETTKNQLGWLMCALSEVPEEWDRVAKEPARAKEVVEEVLRFRSTVTSVGRLALEDLELFGTPVPKGSTVIASLWSANRDDAAFRNPNGFDVDGHRGGAQLAFGQGAHHCLGAALARAELQESLIALAARLECPKLEPGATFLPPVGINGPTTLPVRLALRGKKVEG
ncbi:MAG TPA: cytochrome P450 [Polyangiaceae bacterium]|nr:cytochrome P450 [Polyangiaceae bacterium]